MSGRSATQFPGVIHINAAGYPRMLRTLEDALQMVEKLPPEIARLPRWTFDKALRQEALKSKKSRDLKIATRQLQQAISNEKWS
jgi:hypothetical protein